MQTKKSRPGCTYNLVFNFGSPQTQGGGVQFDFDFIEFFTTTFLLAHTWLNWADEDDDDDEVGLKEKPEDTRYIKNITS